MARLRMEQERRTAVEIRPHTLNPLLRLVPAGNDDVFQFFVEKLFCRFFISGIGHLHKVGQHAGWPQAFNAAEIDGRKQALNRFGSVGAMRENLLERLFARLLPRYLATQFFQPILPLLPLQPPHRQILFDLLLCSPIDCNSSWRATIRAEMSFLTASRRSRSCVAVCSSLRARDVSRSMAARYSSICAS